MKLGWIFFSSILAEKCDEFEEVIWKGGKISKIVLQSEDARKIKIALFDNSQGENTLYTAVFIFKFIFYFCPKYSKK